MHTRLVRSLAPLVVVLGLSSGCRTPVDAGGAVTATIVGDSLRIHNGTSAAIFYLAVEAQTAALINWAPCVAPPECPSVRSESVATIPLTNVYGFDSTSEVALIYWWTRVRVLPFGWYRPGPISATGAHR